MKFFIKMGASVLLAAATLPGAMAAAGPATLVVHEWKGKRGRSQFFSFFQPTIDPAAWKAHHGSNMSRWRSAGITRTGSWIIPNRGAGGSVFRDRFRQLPHQV